MISIFLITFVLGTEHRLVPTTPRLAYHQDPSDRLGSASERLEDAKTQSSGATGNNSAPGWITLSAIIQAISSAVVAGLTIYLVIYTNGLLASTQDMAVAALQSANAARDSADIARDSLLLLEGATIQLQETIWDQPAGWTGVDEYNRSLHDTVVTVLWRNFGRSIAQNVQFDLMLGLGGSSSPDSLPLNPPIIMAPNQTHRYGFTSLGSIVRTADDWTRLVTRSAPLRLWGTVKYTDVFEREHTLEVGATWIPGTDAFAWDTYRASVRAVPKRPTATTAS